jgi:hypothetical protein
MSFVVVRGHYAWLLVVFCALTACRSQPSDGSVPVSGKLTRSGAALTVASAATAEGWVEIRFYGADAAGNILNPDAYHAVSVKEDGTFNVPGPSDRGLPPGRYKLVVRQWDPYPVVDKLEGAFDETRSTIVREITGPTTIELDLAKP